MKKVFRPWAAAVILAAAVLAGLIIAVLFQPKPVWYVEAPLANTWARVLRQGSAPFTKIIAYRPNEGIPRKGLGYCISNADIQTILGRKNETTGETGTGGNTDLPEQLIIYKQLSDNREYQGALLLALDPWMVFFKHTSYPLSRVRVEGRGEGILILPGAESDATRAWASQLLQQSPGVYSGRESLRDMERFLADDPRFQPGSEKSGWSEALSLLMREERSWLYAPLSRIMELPSYRTGQLKAHYFPGHSSWNNFGLQADLVWAIPFGKKGRQKKLDAAETWLRDPKTQTLIANELHWIPADPQGNPYNTLCRDAQLAWLSSSYIWQTKGNEAEDS
jgi:hypothetical protein